jgi:putative NIF3 family GTP cyclohydrolase 1 type 2
VKTNKFSGKRIRTIALCGGSGAFLLPQAIGQGADAFLTGEIKYHDYFGHEDDLLMMEIGHYESEQYTVEIFQTIIKEACPTVPVKLTKVETNPVRYY